MFKIQTFNQISSKGLVRFPGTYEVGPGIASCDAILVRSHKLQESDVNPNLKAVARAGARAPGPSDSESTQSPSQGMRPEPNRLCRSSGCPT